MHPDSGFRATKFVTTIRLPHSGVSDVIQLLLYLCGQSLVTNIDGWSVGRVAHLRRGCGGRGIKGQDTIRGEPLLLLQPSSKRKQIPNFGFRREKLIYELRKN